MSNDAKDPAIMAAIANLAKLQSGAYIDIRIQAHLTLSLPVILWLLMNELISI